jgi:hypothetical protein
MKRSLLLSKVRKSSDKKSASTRRRRPSKKLAASLEALATTLPELPANGASAKSTSSSSVAAAKAGMAESLERKRGLTKRREKMVKAETQRFGQNLAILSLAGAAGAPGEAGKGSGPSREGSWKALRRHLETMSTVGNT